MTDFDPAKDAINLSKHGVSARALVDLDIRTTFVDDRYDYGKIRHRAYGFIDGVAHCLTFTSRDARVAADQPATCNRKEMRRYAP